MQKVKIGIVGLDEEAAGMLEVVNSEPFVDLTILNSSSWNGVNNRPDYESADYVHDFDQIRELDYIFDISGNPQTKLELNKITGSQIKIIDDSGELIKVLRDRLTVTQSHFHGLLDTISDAVLLVDQHGTVVFANSYFETITGVAPSKIIGKAIKEPFPDNPILQCLESGEKKMGQRYFFGEGLPELSFLISPVFIGEKLAGAIGIFKTQPDIVKLMEELQRSSKIIEILYNRLGAINGLTDINVTQIVSIDKMEQIMLRQALAQFGHTVEGKKKAAKALNISLATLYNKLKKYQFS